jgi:uncharacterized metal-binding protein
VQFGGRNNGSLFSNVRAGYEGQWSTNNAIWWFLDRIFVSKARGPANFPIINSFILSLLSTLYIADQALLTAVSILAKIILDSHDFNWQKIII